MNFIESIFDSISIGIKQANGEYPNEIKSYCIGSGSNFIIHRHISMFMALSLYKEYKKNLPLGKKISEKEYGDVILESFKTMESSKGYTYCFLFPITEVIEHNPNDIIEEWIKNDKKHKGFMNDLLNLFYEKKSKQKKVNKNESKQN